MTKQLQSYTQQKSIVNETVEIVKETVNILNDNYKALESVMPQLIDGDITLLFSVYRYRQKTVRQSIIKRNIMDGIKRNAMKLGFKVVPDSIINTKIQTVILNRVCGAIKFTNIDDYLFKRFLYSECHTVVNDGDILDMVKVEDKGFSVPTDINTIALEKIKNNIDTINETTNNINIDNTENE